MQTAQRLLHPKAWRELKEQTQAADKMGRTGVNTYKCTGFCAPEHSDPDVCRGLCACFDWYALPWEYAFCQPSYGYYLHTYENMLWCVTYNEFVPLVFYLMHSKGHLILAEYMEQCYRLLLLCPHGHLQLEKCRQFPRVSSALEAIFRKAWVKCQ